MIINNMRWTLNNNQASGEGPFAVNVQSKGRNSVTSVKGILRLTVVKSNNGSKITEMVHDIK